MEILTNKDTVRFVFNRLRAQEGIEKGRLTSQMDDLVVFKILVNAIYKDKHNQTLTDLERQVKTENGKFIYMYVSQKLEEYLKREESYGIPYLDVCFLTQKDFIKKSRQLA